MYRLVLIEDEPWTLQGLVRVLPWKAYGFELEGTFTDALAGYAHVLRHPPDAVFVDLRMPEMDGFDIITACRQKGIDCLFVIISGYDEFVYAQRAISLGVTDYLIKPVGAAEAEAMFQRLRDRLERRTYLQAARAFDSLQEPKQLTQCLLAMGYALEGDIRWRMLRTAGNQEIQRTCLAMCPGTWIEMEEPGDGRSVLIWYTPGKGRDIDRWLADCAKVNLRAGVSGEGGIDALPALSGQAYKAFRQVFIDPEATFWRYEAPADEDVGLLSIRSALAKPGERAPFRETLERLPTTFREKGWGVEQLEILLSALLHALWREGRPLMQMDAACGGINSWMDRYPNMERLCASAVSLAEQGAPERGTTSGASDQQIARLIETVERSFTENLSLGELSRRHHLNPTYICELFKRATGETITAYVTRRRMEEAARLIAGGERLGDIAQRVGYGDYFYFSRLFKRYYGVPPSRYLERGQAE